MWVAAAPREDVYSALQVGCWAERGPRGSGSVVSKACFFEPALSERAQPASAEPAQLLPAEYQHRRRAGVCLLTDSVHSEATLANERTMLARPKKRRQDNDPVELRCKQLLRGL